MRHVWRMRHRLATPVLMRSTVFPFGLILKIDFGKLNISLFKIELLLAHLHTILLIVEPLPVLSVRNESQSLDVVLSFFIFVFKFFYESYRSF